MYHSKLKATSHWAAFSHALMPALKLIFLFGQESQLRHVPQQAQSDLALGSFLARAYASIEANFCLGKSLNCVISPNKFKAGSHWAHFSKALMPALKLITLARISTAASPTASSKQPHTNRFLTRAYASIEANFV
jgi:hypothetical protein